MLYVWVLLLLVSSAVSQDDDEEDDEPEHLPCFMAGTWKNQMGSRMTLTELESNKFSGTFKTAVETHEGASGQAMTGNVVLNVHPETNVSFAFSVLWGGGSITSWVGQCYVTHKGYETLDTTWLLHTPTTTMYDSWMSTRIGKDYFRRDEK